VSFRVLLSPHKFGQRLSVLCATIFDKRTNSSSIKTPALQRFFLKNFMGLFLLDTFAEYTACNQVTDLDFKNLNYKTK
jgi:hypothetical protein